MLVPVLLLAMAAFGGASKRARRARSTGEALRRVFVDRLSGGETATQMRDMIVSSLQNARLFVITENQERAAVLPGSDDDLVFTDSMPRAIVCTRRPTLVSVAVASTAGRLRAVHAPRMVA